MQQDAELIKLGSGLELDVPPTTTVSERAKLLLKTAQKRGKGKYDEGYHDDKFLITSKGIEALIADGAKVIELNLAHKSTGNTYYHHFVRYEDHQFIASTAKPVIYIVGDTSL